MAFPRLVLVKPERKILLRRKMREDAQTHPYRITRFDELGASGH